MTDPAFSTPGVGLRRISHRGSVFLWAVASAATVACGYVAALIQNRRFFYQDDTEAWAVPNWVYLGRLLRQGTIPILSPEQWMSATWTVEGQDGLWNPAMWIVWLVASGADGRLHLLAAAVKGVFAIVLAIGVYRLALAFGAKAPWAAVAGAATPFTGFFLWFDSTAWVSSMFGMAWLLNMIASLVRCSRGEGGLIGTFVFGYLALSVGYVHTAIETVFVVIAVLVGEWVQTHELRSLVRPPLVATAAGLCSAITYLPALFSSSSTWRVLDSAAITNDSVLSSSWSDSFNAVLPLVSRVVSDFTVWFRDNEVCLSLRLCSCVPVMSRG